MTNGETNTRDKRVVDAYRAASDNLDERPQPATRAAILAAAARAVDAQPHDAQSGATSGRVGMRVRERKRSLVASKRPLALAASFLVATVAVVLATQTYEQQEKQAQVAAQKDGAAAENGAARSENAITSPAAAPLTERDLELKREANGPTTPLAVADSMLQEKVAAAAAAPAPLDPNKRERPNPSTPSDRTPATPSVAPSPPQVGSPPAPPKPATPEAPPTPAKPPSPATPPGTAPDPRYNTEPSQRRERAPVVPPASVSPQEMQPQAGASANAAEKEAAGRTQMRARLTAGEQRAKERADALTASPPPPAASGEGKLAKARPVQRTPAMAEDGVENDPARWMERVIALRDAGRDEDADRELAQLRERFPNVSVPPNALRRTGTR